MDHTWGICHEGSFAAQRASRLWSHAFKTNTMHYTLERVTWAL